MRWKIGFSYAENSFFNRLVFQKLKICLFRKPKAFLSHKPFLKLLSKATLFHPPPPIPPPLNLLFAKNTAILFHFALNPYAVKPESRTDSNHCRRYPENLRFSQNRLLDERRSFYLQPRIDRRFESSPESRGSQTSGVLLVLFVHAKSTKNVPFAGSSEVTQTSNQRTQTKTSHKPN